MPSRLQGDPLKVLREVWRQAGLIETNERRRVWVSLIHNLFYEKCRSKIEIFGNIFFKVILNTVLR